MTKRSSLLTAAASAAVLCIAGARGVAALGEDSSKFLTIDHYVRVTSKVPAIGRVQVPSRGSRVGTSGRA